MAKVTLGLVTAIAKYWSNKIGSAVGTGIQSIELNQPKTALVITFKDGTTSQINSNDLMLSAIYDSNHSGVVDNSKMLDGHPPSAFASKENIDALWNVVVEDFVNGAPLATDLLDLKNRNIAIVSLPWIDNEISQITKRINGLETDTKANNTAIANVIKGDYLGVTGTNLITLDKQDSGVTINGTGLNGLEKRINKDIANGYLGIGANGKVSTNFIPTATSNALGLVSIGEGINLNPAGQVSVKAENLSYVNNKLVGVNNVKAAIDAIATGVIPDEFVITDMTRLQYTEPTGAFNPMDFPKYCGYFPYGFKFIGKGLPDHTAYPKLANFFISSIGDMGYFDTETVIITIENLSYVNGAVDSGVIKYTITNGSQTGVPANLEEYTYIAHPTYNSAWEKTYGDYDMVCCYNNAQMNEFISFAGSKDLGKTVIKYEDGNVYQVKATPPGSSTSYMWEQRTLSLPVNGINYLSGQTNITISAEGHYIIFGDVTNLTITATTPVTINVLGTVTNLKLPTTTATIDLNVTKYDGADLATATLTPLIPGSIIGKFHYGCIAL